MRRRPAPKRSWSATFFWGFGCVGVLVGLGIWILSMHRWDGKSRYTLITISPHLQIETLNPATGQGFRFALPDNLEIDSVDGRGKWLAGMIGEAGRPAWVADSVADYLGITYQGVSTSINWWDLWTWKRTSGKMAWKDIDLANSPYVAADKTADGLDVLHINSTWDNKARDFFADAQIAEAALGVTIVNTTNTPGLGANATRSVESMGFKVRELTSEGPEVDSCVVRSIPSLKSSWAVRRLLATYKCIWQSGDDSDLDLRLGKQYRLWKAGR